MILLGLLVGLRIIWLFVWDILFLNLVVIGWFGYDWL